MEKSKTDSETFPTPAYFVETASWRDFVVFFVLTVGYSVIYTIWGKTNESSWIFTFLHTAGQIAPVAAIVTTFLSVGEYAMFGLLEDKKRKLKEEGRQEGRQEVVQWYESKLREKGIDLEESSPYHEGSHTRTPSSSSHHDKP